MRDVVGTNNIDSSAAFGYAGVQKSWEKAFGLNNHPVTLNSPLGKDVILVLESDISVTHPVFGLNFLQAKRDGSQLIVADSRETKLTRHSTQWLGIKDGTSTALLNGIMKVIIDKGLHNKDAASAVSDFDSLKSMLDGYTPDKVSALTGIDAEEITAAADAYANANSRLISLSIGSSENTKGLDTVLAAANIINLMGDGPGSLQIPAQML